MADRQLGVRVPEEVAKAIEAIAKGINTNIPTANVSNSDILRSAIEEYVKRAEEEKDNIFVKLPCNRNLTVKEAAVLLEAMKHVQGVINSDSVNSAVAKYEERLEYAEFLDWKSKNKGGK